MNCPPDYICSATPAWVFVASIALLVIVLLVLVAFVEWGGR